MHRPERKPSSVPEGYHGIGSSLPVAIQGAFKRRDTDSLRRRAALKVRTNKTDRNDARGLAELARLGHYKVVHIKTDQSLRARATLSARELLLRKLKDLQSSIRGLLQPFGIKIPACGRSAYDGVVRKLLAGAEYLREIIEPLLQLRTELACQVKMFDNLVKQLASDDPVCRLLMTAPGVGPLVALTYRSAVDIPERFERSRDVGAHFGLAPKTRQSGASESRLRISKCGDRKVRSALFLAAKALMPSHRRPCELQAWGQALKERSNTGKARIAVARRLAMILHRMWMSNTEFRWERTERDGVSVA